MNNDEQQQKLRDLALATGRLLNFHAVLGLEYPKTSTKNLFVKSNQPHPPQNNKPAPAIAKPPKPQPNVKKINSPILADLNKQINSCSACPLRENSRPFIGKGSKRNPISLLVVVDPRQGGQPPAGVFTDEAETLFHKMLTAINLHQDKIFYTNICKCSILPKQKLNNKMKTSCLSHLKQQLDFYSPRLILTMGSMASGIMLANNHQLAALRGRIHKFQGIPLIATYHPATLLQYADFKKGAWQDLQLVQRQLQKQ